MVDESCICCRSPPLKCHAQYASQDTIATVAIPHIILWTGQLFVCYSSAGDKDGSTKASISITPSRTLSTFYRPLCLLLSSCVSTYVTLVVPHILFHTYPPLNSSSWIFCPRYLTYITHICCFCPNRPASPLTYPLPFLSTSPSISRFCFCCNYHTDYPLKFSFATVYHISASLPPS